MFSKQHPFPARKDARFFIGQLASMQNASCSHSSMPARKIIIISSPKPPRGFNVLHPIGWDAFGLPAEQHAVKTGTHPAANTQNNIVNFRRQLGRLGLGVGGVVVAAVVAGLAVGGVEDGVAAAAEGVVTGLAAGALGGLARPVGLVAAAVVAGLVAEDDAVAAEVALRGAADGVLVGAAGGVVVAGRSFGGGVARGVGVAGAARVARRLCAGAARL